MILDQFLFLDETSSGAESAVYSVPPGAETLTLQVSKISPYTGDVGVQVYGQVDTELDYSTEAFTQGIIDMHTMGVVENQEIVDTGIYMVAVAGLRKISVYNGEAASQGHVKVFGVIS